MLAENRCDTVWLVELKLYQYVQLKCVVTLLRSSKEIACLSANSETMGKVSSKANSSTRQQSKKEKPVVDCQNNENEPSRLDKHDDEKTLENSALFKENKVVRMTPMELYNLVVAETWQGMPQIAEPDSILLFDCRDKGAYDSGHVSTARQWSVFNSNGLQSAQMKRYQIIILYGYEEFKLEVSNKLLELKLEHYILNCSASAFLAKYPFLSCLDNCTNIGALTNMIKILPSEIITGCLYQGNAKQAADLDVILSLGISHIVNVTLEQPNKFPEKVQYFNVPLDDRSDEDLLSWLPKIISFINGAIQTTDTTGTKSRGRVLVHCNLGRSRSSTAVIGYLMSANGMSLLEACNLVKDCRPTAKPNVGFLEQLLKFEKATCKSKSDFSDLPF